MLISSRSLAEYRAMFALEDGDLSGSILDCAAGGSSFIAELGDRGDHIATDPAYARSDVELAAALQADRDQCVRIAGEHRGDFVWDWYGTPQRRDEFRTASAERFLVDRAQHPERYVAASLPELPFDNDSVDLVLCSHLLFTWASSLDLDWHEAACVELIRVARREVRLYPLIQLGAGDVVPFHDQLIDRIRARGHTWSERLVDLRFQRRAGVMAVLTP